jgi:hypothetical protein
MKEKNYKICKDGREVSNITRAGDVTILDAALGVAYSETEANFNAYLNELKKHGYTIIKNF